MWPYEAHRLRATILPEACKKQTNKTKANKQNKQKKQITRKKFLSKPPRSLKG